MTRLGQIGEDALVRRLLRAAGNRPAAVRNSPLTPSSALRDPPLARSRPLTHPSRAAPPADLRQPIIRSWRGRRSLRNRQARTRTLPIGKGNPGRKELP